MICEQSITKQHARTHVVWHFIDELRVIVNGFPNKNKCNLCEYTNPNSDKVARHLALGHSKLDELLRDRDMVEKKRQVKSQSQFHPGVIVH